ncbi:hypothetical protein [Vibrio salinus]|uniref:hypothetical protein n=1 Tax=Vibrio salinus TaxID=2899784 RepID=UPI001E471DF0|nr:hypothetical protein [Vibrio salinus]MCE0495360.1 hypothetical protein [Vibrio salinus]
MNNFFIDNGEQVVREVIADLLELFSEQIKEGHDPKTVIKYFGATLEVRLVDFEGSDVTKEENDKCVVV